MKPTLATILGVVAALTPALAVAQTKPAEAPSKPDAKPAAPVAAAAPAAPPKPDAKPTAQATPAPANPTPTPAPAVPPVVAPPPASPGSPAPASAAPPTAPATSPAATAPTGTSTPAGTPAPAAAPATVTTPAPEVASPAPAPGAKKPAAPPAPQKRFLGLALATPDSASLIGKIRPSFGMQALSSSDWKFDFHGFLNVPLRLGLNSRKDPLETQYKTVLHGPPLVPDEHERFEHTGTVPDPWVQLGFSFGNSDVVANVIIAAKSVTNAQGFFNPPTQLGINDAFLTFKPNWESLDAAFDVGAFAERYGNMGEYDTGRYDTPVIARIGGVGGTGRASVPLTDELSLLAEVGMVGQWDRAPLGVEPAGWNDFADPNVGTSFAHHEHLGLALDERAKLALHYAVAFTHDDRTVATQPDGSISVLGADIEGQFAPFGRAYAAISMASADNARSVSGVMRVLNTRGGLGLMNEYLGPNSRGTGKLTTVGAQYDVSIGEIVRDPRPFSGYGPDIVVSAFGMFTHVQSEDKTTVLRLDDGSVELNVPGGEPLYDGVNKLKYGFETTYSMLSWLAASLRYDRVVANLDDTSKTFAVISPAVILKSDFNSQDQVTLRYSHWMYGSGVTVREGYPPRDVPWVEPDSDTVSLTASMWW